MEDWIEKLKDIEDFEELNILQTRKSIPYDKYFGEMDLTKEQKEKRKSFAEKLDDVMLFIFALFSIMKANEYTNREYVRKQLYDRYMDVVSGFMTVDEYLNEYINQFSDNTIDTTILNIETPFFLSVDRAVLISENEANSVYNYQDFIQAILQGKTRKKWVDIRDNRERKTHREVGGKTIPIARAFDVGKYLMLFPHDLSMGAGMEEIANCRCTIKYF